MEKYIFDQNNGLWYELRGDYSHPMKLYRAVLSSSLVMLCHLRSDIEIAD